MDDMIECPLCGEKVEDDEVILALHAMNWRYHPRRFLHCFCGYGEISQTNEWVWHLRDHGGFLAHAHDVLNGRLHDSEG